MHPLPLRPHTLSLLVITTHLICPTLQSACNYRYTAPPATLGRLDALPCCSARSHLGECNGLDCLVAVTSWGGVALNSRL